VLRALAAAPAGSTVYIGCGLGAAHPQLLIHRKAVALAALAGLQPAPRFAHLIAKATAALALKGAYDVVHLRVENDWPALCDFWRSRPRSPDAAFCGDDVPPPEIVARLEAAGVGGDGARRVFVAVDTDALDGRGWAVVNALRARFAVALRADVLADALPRELGALVDYHLSIKAHTWVGNSYSTFSGLIILQRRLEGRAAAWWNGGRVVLEDSFPLFGSDASANAADPRNVRGRPDTQNAQAHRRLDAAAAPSFVAGVAVGVAARAR